MAWLLRGGSIFHSENFKFIYLQVWLIFLPAMTSAFIFEDATRNDTQMSFIFKRFLHFSVCVPPINFNFTSYSLTSTTLTLSAGTSKDISLDESESLFPAIPNHFHISSFKNHLPIHDLQIHRNFSSSYPWIRQLRRFL